MKEGQQLALQDISLVHGAVVKGRVIAEEGGAPVSGFNLFVYKYRSSNTIGDTTAPDGTFQIRVPAGSHSLVLNLNGEGLYNRPKTAAIVGTQKMLDYVPRTADWNFDIADGQTLNLEFRLPKKVKPYPIDVLVLGPDGAPVEGAFVVTGDVSNPTRGVGKGWQQGGTNAEGHTKVFGPITVRAFKGTAATSQAVRADGDKVTLRLEENALASLKGPRCRRRWHADSLCRNRAFSGRC